MTPHHLVITQAAPTCGGRQLTFNNIAYCDFPPLLSVYLFLSCGDPTSLHFASFSTQPTRPTTPRLDTDCILWYQLYIPTKCTPRQYEKTILGFSSSFRRRCNSFNRHVHVLHCIAPITPRKQSVCICVCTLPLQLDDGVVHLNTLSCANVIAFEFCNNNEWHLLYHPLPLGCLTSALPQRASVWPLLLYKTLHALVITH